MSELKNQAKERLALMEEYFQVKAEMERVAEENAQLRAENEKLSVDVSDRENAMQNLFSYIHGAS